MLVLSRKKNESILIDGCIRVTVVDTGNNTVRIGIQAPRDKVILRGELQTTENVVEQPASAAPFVVDSRENLREVAI
jgi:carbon storage regulator